MDQVVEELFTDQQVLVHLEEVVIHLQFLLHKDKTAVMDLHLVVAVLVEVAEEQLPLVQLQPNQLQPTV